MSNSGDAESQPKSEHTDASKDAKEAIATPPKKGNDAAAILEKPPFIIRAFKYGKDGSEDTGSILSQSLDKIMKSKNQTDPKLFTMAALRKLVPGMSRFPSIERFCTPTGTVIDDESIKIVEYLELEADETAPKSGTPSLNIYYRSTKLGGSAGQGSMTDAKDAIPALGEVKAKDAPDVTNLEKSSDTKDLITDYEVSTGNEHAGAGTLTEAEWTVVLRNCGVFYGWIIDPRTKKITRAPKPAFQLRSKVSQQLVSKIPDFASSKSIKSGDEEQSSKDDIGSDSIAAVTPKTDQGIPNFRVNDDSRIEITAHEDELTVALARSDFSEQSTEASFGGSGWGASVGVSVGFASSSSNTSKSMKNSLTRTLIARYMFPRCDLILWPDEMEPTPELAELIETIRTTKSIKALRRLHAEFGHLFSQNLTLGGRLLSTKIVKTTEQKTLDEHKESFKTSVGATMSASYFGVSATSSMKHEQAAGSTSLSETSARSQDESLIFEAVGGDTILASNPKAWCPTVGNHELWRVINREGLSPLAEVLSSMPGYSAVQSWFVQAVPALSQYMTLDDSHMCKARFRVTSPTNSLSIRNDGVKAAYYLGHDAGGPTNGAVTPRLNGIDTSSQQFYWNRVDITQDIPIFNPKTYRAPTILGYKNFMVENTPYGAEYNAAYAKSEWDIIAPFDDALRHGTRVVIRSCPFQDPAKAQTSDASKQTASAVGASHMVVFRNAQGEFLPGMSDSDEYHYWRILKVDRSEEYIKPGDDIRLCWDFRDQKTGWRDFTQDVFGRRQVSAPPDTASPLYLKVPWPRFEVENTPTALIMSPDPSSDPTAKMVNIDNIGKTQTLRYCLQDLRLRIDSVGSDGRGDSDDYLLNKVDQKGIVQNFTIRWMSDPMRIKGNTFWFGVV